MTGGEDMMKEHSAKAIKHFVNLKKITCVCDHRVDKSEKSPGYSAKLLWYNIKKIHRLPVCTRFKTNTSSTSSKFADLVKGLTIGCKITMILHVLNKKKSRSLQYYFCVQVLYTSVTTWQERTRKVTCHLSVNYWCLHGSAAPITPASQV